MMLALRVLTCIPCCLLSIANLKILPSGDFSFLSSLSHSLQTAECSHYCHNNKQQFSYTQQPMVEVTILHLRGEKTKLKHLVFYGHFIIFYKGREDQR